MKREKKNGKLDKRNLLLVEREYDNIRPDEIYGNVLSLKASQANVPYPLTGNLSPWKDQSRGYEVALANAVTNGDFSNGTTGWTPTASALSVLSNKMTITGAGGSTYPRMSQATGIGYASGKKVRVSAKIKVTNSVCLNAGVEIRATGMTTIASYQANPVNGTEYNISAVIALTSGGSGDISVVATHGYADAATANGKVMEVQEVMCIDLSTPFQATREPSIPDIQRAMEEAGTTFWSGTKTLRFRNNATLSNFAGTATSGWVQEWIECQTGAEKSVVNLLGDYGNFGTDGNADGLADGWMVEAGIASKSVSGNIQTTTANEFNGRYNATKTGLVSGDKIYFAALLKVASGANVKIQAYCPSGTSGNGAMVGTGEFAFVSALGVTGGSSAFFYVIDSRASGWTPIQVKQAHVLNLTTIFGPGNEPTQPEMDKIVQRAIAAYGYINTRTLKLARRWMLRLDGSDDFLSLTNSLPLDLGVTAGKEQAWAVTFRAAIGATNSYLICKNLNDSINVQYGILYKATSPNNTVQLFLNGSEFILSLAEGSIVQNEVYNLIFYRNSLGVVTPYLNKVAKPTATYANALTTRPNVRIGRRETASAHFKGDIFSENMYEADKLDINQILRAEWQVARDYVA